VKIRFVPEAAKDLGDAFEWYESERKGLGKRFVLMVEESILRIARYPLFNTEVKPDIYRSLVKRMRFITRSMPMVFSFTPLPICIKNTFTGLPALANPS
jgi:hypothetical protein